MAVQHLNKNVTMIMTIVKDVEEEVVYNWDKEDEIVEDQIKTSQTEELHVHV